MHIDQAENLVARMKTQWPDPRWTAGEETAWIRMFSDPNLQYNQQEVLSQLTAWTRESARRPRITEIVEMVRRHRPPTDTEDFVDLTIALPDLRADRAAGVGTKGNPSPPYGGGVPMTRTERVAVESGQYKCCVRCSWVFPAYEPFDRCGTCRDIND